MNEEKYLGQSKRSAQFMAESDNFLFRLISVDGEQFMNYPEDHRDDRICVEIVANKVVKVSFQ